VYRLALIDQKQIEAELLELLKWTHEEALNTMEEYQRRERSYEQALISYQKRIADMLRDMGLSDIETENVQFRQQLSTLERENAQYKERLATAEARIKTLEEELERLNQNSLRRTLKQ